MKGFLFLADAARAHGDSTVSLLRGGITQLTAVKSKPTQPIAFRCAIVARARGSSSESGEHGFTIRVVNAAGDSVLPDVEGTIEIPEGGGAANVLADVAAALPGPGTYTIRLLVDDEELDTWEISALLQDPPASPEDRR